MLRTLFHLIKKNRLSPLGVSGVKTWIAAGLLLAFPAAAADLLLVIGAAGTPEYATQFRDTATLWQDAATKSGGTAIMLDSEKEKAPLDRLAEHLTVFSKPSPEPFWLVLIGHGTSDGRDSHFNLPGTDLSSTRLAALLSSVDRELVIIDTTAASGPFIQALSGARRTIVTATKSPDEVYYARFGQHLARAISGHIEADRDQDQQVSLLEAFLFAANETRQFYEKEERIATEHALLDDNGDKQGTRSEAFTGLKAKPVSESAKPDGLRAMQLHLVLNPEEQKLPPEVRAQRDALEAKVRDLAEKKASLQEADYYNQLEALLRQIATLSVTKP